MPGCPTTSASSSESSAPSTRRAGRKSATLVNDITASDLDDYLARQEPVSEGTADWAGGIKLRIAGYLSTETPPLDLVSSVRAIVLKEADVLVMRNQDGTHILPGGRVEKGEGLVEALRRELLEEAGLDVHVENQIGLLHLRHTTPRPEGYPNLYPDFLQPVYAAPFAAYRPQAKVADDYEISSRFLPLAEVRKLELEDFEAPMLDAAVAAT